MLYYFATPYTNYPDGEDAASDLACRETGRLLDAGVLVFCPIAHFHAIRRVIGPRPHSYWLTADQPFMDAAAGLIVLRATGWLESVGVQFEIKQFMAAGKPLILMDVGCVPPELASAAPSAPAPAAAATPRSSGRTRSRRYCP